MTKCKYCEEITQDKDFCNEYCINLYDKFGMRQTLVRFAHEMEVVMQEKDKLRYTNKDKSLEFLVNKLKEERAEVDYELIGNLPLGNIDKELLHEAIMTMLVRQRIKDYGKFAKLE